MEKEKKVLEDSAAEKDALLRRKIKSIGNYVHDSVPVSNNEVYDVNCYLKIHFLIALSLGQQCSDPQMEAGGHNG